MTDTISARTDYPVSFYVSGRGVAAFHQKSYPKRRPLQRDDLRLVVLRPSGHVGEEPSLTYQDFIDGDFRDATRLTA